MKWPLRRWIRVSSVVFGVTAFTLVNLDSTQEHSRSQFGSLERLLEAVGIAILTAIGGAAWGAIFGGLVGIGMTTWDWACKRIRHNKGKS